jgi:hypothetical protein
MNPRQAPRKPAAPPSHPTRPPAEKVGTPQHWDPGSIAYKLATLTHNASSHNCCDLGISTADNMTLEEINNYLMDDPALAEVMDYLTGTYGPGFIEKLIKHLPHLRPR